MGSLSLNASVGDGYKIEGPQRVTPPSFRGAVARPSVAAFPGRRLSPESQPTSQITLLPHELTTNRSQQDDSLLLLLRGVI
jgi:hypothetical protein